MKKFLLILCVICLVAPICFVFTGCGSKQITIKQIHDAVRNADSPVFQEQLPTSESFNVGINNHLLAWQRTFERNNIDTEYFMAMDHYDFYYGSLGKSCYVLIFKFKDDKAANNFCNNFDFTEHHGQEYESRTYGNLVVAVHSGISDYNFDIINSI